jgi:murein peptide amidase A
VVHKPYWRTSQKGRPIALYTSANLKKEDHPILIMGGIHGDEPEGVALAKSTLQFLAEDAEKIQVPWILVPCLNVDGFAENQRTNGAGVDLNRNYPSRDWNPEFPKDRYFPGPKAASEPEIQGVVKLIEDYRPRLIIHCHSWNPCVVYAGEPGRKDAERLGQACGYEVRDDIGYPTPGSLSQYAWGDLKIPVICIEEAEGTAPEKVWPHFERGMREIFADPSPRRANL